jgi:hypothetical protein
MFHWKNVPVYTATIMMDWMMARQIKLVEHPPYLPDLAPVVHFLFPRAKRELAGFTLTQEKLKKEREGAVWSIAAPDFTEAFSHWFQRHEKCVTISRGDGKKI